MAAEPVFYQDDALESVRDQLLGLDGVMVWVNPIQDGSNRSHLDALLREVAASGVWVSAHPDVILTLGTKEVLYRTRDLGWGTDTDLYRDAADFRARFPARPWPTMQGSCPEAGPRQRRERRVEGSS